MYVTGKDMIFGLVPYHADTLLFRATRKKLPQEQLLQSCLMQALIIFKISTRKVIDMSRYVYPAVITPEDGGCFAVIFPDLKGCYTSGDSLADCLLMAEDALALTLYQYESQHIDIPVPSDKSKLHVESNEIISLVACDTLVYRKRFGKKSIKKTLTIPEWLNEAASDAGINFSEVLQDALVKKLSL